MILRATEQEIGKDAREIEDISQCSLNRPVGPARRPRRVVLWQKDQPIKTICTQTLYIGGSQWGSSKSRDSSLFNHATSCVQIFLEENRNYFFTFQMWIFTKATHKIDQERCQNVPGGLFNESTVQNLEKLFHRAQIWTAKIRYQVKVRIPPCFLLISDQEDFDFYPHLDDVITWEALKDFNDDNWGLLLRFLLRITSILLKITSQIPSIFKTFST